LARTLSYQVSILTLGRLVSFAALFLVPIVNVRLLSQADYGLYRQFWLLFDTVSVVLVLGFPASLLYYFPRAENKAEKSVYLTQTLVYLLITGGISWLVYGAMTIFLRGDLGDAVREYTWAFCLFTLFMMVSKVMERLFVAEKRAEQQSLYIALSFFVQAATVIAVSWYTHRVDLIIWGLVAFAFAKALFTLVYCSSAYNFSLGGWSLKSFKEQVSYAVPLGLATVVLLVFGQTDKYVITHFLGREIFAVYSVGVTQLPFVDIIRNSVMNVIFPLMAEHQKKGEFGEILTLWRRATLKMAVVFVPIFVFLEVSARPFITVLFTEEYAAATPIFMIYLLVFLRSTVDTTTVIMVFKKNTFMFKVNLVALVAHVTLSILMFKKFGWLGVPATTVAIVYIQNGVFLWKSARLLGCSLWSVMPWGRMLLRFLTAAVVGGALYFAYQIRPAESFLELCVAGAAYFTVYFGLSFAFRFISIADIRSMLGRPAD
jgi:O-antigen/teichoic acid export membrane protein